MENATKALLIAAAVLIAILIISLGVVIYTKASETVEGVGDMSEYQIQQFNEKFRKYEGTNESGADVNALLQTVFNHNNAQADNTTCVSVTVGTETKISASNEITTSPTPVSTGARYTIECTFNAQSKLVTSITVTQNTSGS